MKESTMKPPLSQKQKITGVWLLILIVDALFAGIKAGLQKLGLISTPPTVTACRDLFTENEMTVYKSLKWETRERLDAIIDRDIKEPDCAFQSALLDQLMLIPAKDRDEAFSERTEFMHKE
jgi:hypothetical protein